MSNRISRTLIITHDALGVSIRFARHGRDPVHSQPMQMKTYHPESPVVLSWIDLVLSNNPPTHFTVQMSDATVIMSYHYSCFYLDKTRRDFDREYKRVQLTGMQVFGNTQVMK